MLHDWPTTPAQTQKGVAVLNSWYQSVLTTTKKLFYLQRALLSMLSKNIYGKDKRMWTAKEKGEKMKIKTAKV